MINLYNEIFKQLLTEYNLSEELSFSVDLPTEVQTILEDKILITDLGVTLKSMNRLYKATNDWENQSIIEDNENHFHVEWYLEASDNKKAFMLGVKTLISLADKFQKEKLVESGFGIRFKHPNLLSFGQNKTIWKKLMKNILLVTD